MKFVEVAIDAALAEVRRQGGPEYLLAEARSEGLAAAKTLEAALIDRICFQIGQVHDTSELWGHMQRDPAAFRAAVRSAIDRSAAPSIVHILSQEGQPYGSERRCCNYCGVMLWGPAVPPHVDNWTDWHEAPNNCRATEKVGHGG